MTKEEFREGQIKTTQEEQGDIKASAQKSNAQWTAGQLDFIRSELSNTNMPGATLSWYAAGADRVLAAASAKVGIDVGSKEPIPKEAKEKLRKEIQRQIRIAQDQIEAQKKRK